MHGGRAQHSAFSAAAGAAWPPDEAAAAESRHPAGSAAAGGAKTGPGAPSDEELLAGLDPQELWQDVQQHASVGAGTLCLRTCRIRVPSVLKGVVSGIQD